jgi:hypothetical protein
MEFGLEAFVVLEVLSMVVAVRQFPLRIRDPRMEISIPNIVVTELCCVVGGFHSLGNEIGR